MEKMTALCFIDLGKKVTREISGKITGGCLACSKYENNRDY
jgi:hypothetical protein